MRQRTWGVIATARMPCARARVCVCMCQCVPGGLGRGSFMNLCDACVCMCVCVCAYLAVLVEVVAWMSFQQVLTPPAPPHPPEYHLALRQWVRLTRHVRDHLLHPCSDRCAQRHTCAYTHRNKDTDTHVKGGACKGKPKRACMQDTMACVKQWAVHLVSSLP